MDLDNIEISHFYHSTREHGSFKFKENVEDFVVQELTEDGICEIKPIMNINKYYESEGVMRELPITADKLARKQIYDKARHYPFKRLKTVDGTIVSEDTNSDIFVCTLMKYNLNTSDAVAILSSRLGIPKCNIQFSGNKDKKAITFQEISINCKFDNLFNYAISLLKDRTYLLESYGYKDSFDTENEAIIEEIKKHIEVSPSSYDDRIKLFDIRKGSSKKLGDHLGNRFAITIKGLSKIGMRPEFFYNYFGPQRFGNNMNNHIIGEYILAGQYDKALDVILEDRSCAHSESSDDNDTPEVYNRTQKYIIKMRSKGEKAKYIVLNLDRTTRMMYMHAYQSHKFNEEVNQRIAGGKPVPGDKVLSSGEFIDAPEGTKLEDIYIPLMKGDDKFLKGGYRKMIEEIKDFSCQENPDSITVRFTLGKSCYATSALREMIGNSIFEADRQN